MQKLLLKPLDFGCRPVVTEEPDGALSVGVIASSEQMQSLRQDGYDVSVHVAQSADEPPADVGKGDRFAEGRIALEGLGEKVRDDEESAP
ncbi:MULTISPECIES: hypothetical protein [unclassified Streptomyces]|nr:hypothetical protein [Streptomyces sp. NBC_00306]